MALKIWKLRPADPGIVHVLEMQLGLEPPIAQLLVARGFDTPEKAYRFLNPSRNDLNDPFLFKQMPVLIERLKKARQKNEKVLIYGDYDVDGITSVALLFDTMKQLRFDVHYHVPHRLEEGYGLSVERLKEAREKGVSIILTVDCGTKESEPVEAAREVGLDVLVTDHHISPDALPPAYCILNPQVPDCGYPDSGLCGVGVAYKVAQALHKTFTGEDSELDWYHDLVTLGTVADVVPLLGENRYLVRRGLETLRKSKRPGIRALMEVSETIQERLSARQIAYQIAPRINALGRLMDAGAAVRLLLTQDDDEAMEIARLMNEINSERQTLQRKVVEEIRRKANAEPELFAERVIVLAHPNWHQGVVGIAASKVSEWYYRPAVLLSIDGDVACGSGRSIPGFNLTAALEQCSDLLLQFGGHEMASGLSLPVENIDALSKRLNEIALDKLAEEAMTAELTIDAEIQLDRISERLIEQMESLRPFGEGNPPPRFVAHRISAGDSARIVGNGSLKLTLTQGNAIIDGIAFGQGHCLDNLELHCLDAVFCPSVNDWRGQRRLQMRIEQLRSSQGPTPIHAETERASLTELAPAKCWRILDDKIELCWDKFLKRYSNTPAAIVLDVAQRRESLNGTLSHMHVFVESGDCSSWETSQPPEVVAIIPGRPGPDHFRQTLASIAASHPGVETCVLFARSEAEELLRNVESIYPCREDLLEFYRALKDQFTHEYFELDDIMTVLKDYSRESTLRCLKIFRELELIEQKADGERICLKRVRARRDLQMSPTFRQGELLRKRWIDWIEGLRGPEVAFRGMLKTMLCQK